MARIFPFQPYRYTPAAGPLDQVVTQPYDKISPAMRERYLSLSPYNLVRIILGERRPDDGPAGNVYTRAAAHLNDWIAGGILARDAEPAFYAYFQEFTVPDVAGKLVRKGFVGLGAVEDYSAGVVHRHEQTLKGPKQDRLELLRHTHAHFGQIFMLYPDPALAIDRILDQAATQPPTAQATDEYDVVHRAWRIVDPASVAQIAQTMADKKLLIADGHHRYETALAFSRENPALPGADRVMMTFVNMHSPGLRILATHRLVNGLSGFDAAVLVARTGASAMPLERLRQTFASPAPDRLRVGIVLPGTEEAYLIDRPRGPEDLDVRFLHDGILAGVLGISEQDVREEKYLKYVRGLDAAVERVRAGDAQVAFLLEPTTVEQVARVAFSGGVMPQKSTDFYPKLLSGLTIYKLGGGFVGQALSLRRGSQPADSTPAAPSDNSPDTAAPSPADWRFPPARSDSIRRRQRIRPRPGSPAMVPLLRQTRPCSLSPGPETSPSDAGSESAPGSRESTRRDRNRPRCTCPRRAAASGPAACSRR
jgi:uncharacterized protein (DUF1015 family)